MSKSAHATIRSFQSEIAAIRETPEPFSIRMTMHVMTGMVLVFVALIVFMKLDRVITSSAGKVVLTAPRNVFQALDPSIIKSIDVHPGDLVHKGQVLATLDPTFAAADVTQFQQQVSSLNAQILRDEAELSGAPLEFPPTRDPTQAHYNDIQKALYTQRFAQYRAQIDSFAEKEKLAEATLAKTKGDIARYKERLDIAAQVEAMRTKLLASGAGSLLNQLSSKDQRVELLRTLENLNNGMNEAQAQLSSARADHEAFVQQWSTTISQDLVTARNTRDGALAQLEKAQKHSDLVRIAAQQDSIILTVAKLSVGSVLKEGDELMTAMPVGVPVEAEVNVASRDIGFLRVGDPAVLKVDAFNVAEHGYAEGHVKWISEGAFTTNEDTGQPAEPYYRVRIAIDGNHFVKVPENFRLMPGMTLSADMKVGRRSVAMYLMDGLIRGAGEAMREP